MSKEYKKGYDRLTNGPAITEGISYLHCGSKRLINFSLGLECTQGFTQNRRDYNFDQMKKAALEFKAGKNWPLEEERQKFLKVLLPCAEPAARIILDSIAADIRLPAN